jgi:serine/threonine-protein kinase RsbW
VDDALTGDGHAAVRLIIPAKPEYITLSRLALAGLSRLRPLPEDVLGDLKLALTEACTNSVRHAYDGGRGVVEILYELHADRVVVVVTDTGDGFQAPTEESEPDELNEGGLGIAIIRALSDEVEITEREGGGSILRFVKRLDD